MENTFSEFEDNELNEADRLCEGMEVIGRWMEGQGFRSNKGEDTDTPQLVLQGKFYSLTLLGREHFFQSYLERGIVIFKCCRESGPLDQILWYLYVFA